MTIHVFTPKQTNLIRSLSKQEFLGNIKIEKIAFSTDGILFIEYINVLTGRLELTQE